MCGLVAISGYAVDALPVDRRELLAIRDAMVAAWILGGCD